jgi:hypothetical protein
MAVNAKFQADFASFQAAVQKAEVSLKSFETGAGRVEKELNKMANSFSGTKLIQDANLSAAAIEKIGGVSRLTEAEQKRVNATISEALAKYQALGQTAPAHLHQLAQATAQVEKSTSLASQAAGVLKSAFGQFTAANLASSAIQGMVSSVAAFAAEGKKLPGLQSSFDNLTRSVEQDSRQMLTALREGSAGMVTDINLIQGANKALLLGLPATSDEMGQLAETARILGRAMGQDATKSLDDLITALGRSSPLILDNLGLTVKVGEANDAYAKKLGKTAEQLTEAEKKTAFYEAAMSAARQKTEELGDEVRTLGDRVQQLSTKFGNTVTGTVAGLDQALGRSTSSWRNFGQFLQDVIQHGAGVAIAMQEAAVSVEDLKRAMKRDVNLPLPEDMRKRLEEQAEAQRKAKEAAEKHAEAVKALHDEISGAGAVKDLKVWADALKQSGATAKVLADADLRRKLGMALDEVTGKFGSLKAAGVGSLTGLQGALKALSQQAETIPPKLTDSLSVMTLLQMETKSWANANTQTLLKMVAEGGLVLKGYTEAQIKSFLRVKEETASWQKELDGLSRAMSDLAQTTGSGLVNQLASTVNAFNVVTKAADSFKGGLDNLTSGKGLSSILSGFTGIVGGIAGIVSAAQTAINIGKALFNIFDRDKGRDMVEDFAKSLGGFDQLHAMLNKLGEEGERLWIKLTQGVGRNNKEQAAAAIEEVRRALEALEKTARSVPTDIDIDVGLTYHRGTPEFEEVPEFAGGSGGFRNFGSGTLAMLHGTEAVIRPEDLAKMGGEPTDDTVVAAMMARIDQALRRQPEMIAIALRDVVAQVR